MHRSTLITKLYPPAVTFSGLADKVITLASAASMAPTVALISADVA